MLYNEVLIKSQARGGCELAGTLDIVNNSRISALFSHNSSGNKDDFINTELSKYLLANNISTMRYNFHYVDRFPVQEAQFDDVMMDVDASYTMLVNRAVVPNVYLLGKSLGGAVSLEFSIRNQLKNPIIILGFYEPLVTKYITEARLKSLRSKVLVLQGEKDQYSNPAAIRAYFGRNSLSFLMYEIKNAQHSLESFDESVRTTADILQELKNKISEFIKSTTF
ncbi:MAG: alpha/beta family hydrolase [Patescibacteria group bacterium]